MIDKTRCPMCGTTYAGILLNCSRNMTGQGYKIKCSHYNFACEVHHSVWDTYVSGHSIDEHTSEVCRRFNAIVIFLLQKPKQERRNPESWNFFYNNETIGQPVSGQTRHNVANYMVEYPQSFKERVDKVLRSLSGMYPTLGYKIEVNGYDRALYYAENQIPEENYREIRGMLDRLAELGYVSGHPNNGYVITAAGWMRIGELSRAENEIKQGFIAMDFDKKADDINEAFHDAIRECGYIPRRLDQKEHNNQIVPEIFFEIKRSKFLVVDVTYPNYGAYYEAGYGEALGKQVIVCCKKDVFDSRDNKEKPHFDIAQKSAVVWSDLDDLKARLKARIEATVSLNQNG